MKIALTQAYLKVKCYSYFTIVADNLILATDTSETKFRLKVFGAAFFKKGQYSSALVGARCNCLLDVLDLCCDTLEDLLDSSEAWNGNILALSAVVVGNDSCLLVVNRDAVADNILRCIIGTT